ncbi:MAG: FliH/SctL family protein [bacterium]
MSSVWKKPSISPQLAVVETLPAAPMQQDTVTNQLNSDGSNSRCRRCQAHLATIMKDNILAATKFKVAALEKAARKCAEDIITQAELEAADIKEQAKAEGYRSGYDTGYDVGRNEAERLKEQAKLLIVQAESERANMLAEVRPQVLELALAIAERILRRELAESPYTTIELLKAAVDKLPDGEAVTVEVSPGMATAWLDAEEMVQEAMGDRSYRIIESPYVPTGEFLLSSEVGNVDARLQPQLDICRRQLLEENADALPEAGFN